jgi:hypothetical protein
MGNRVARRFARGYSLAPCCDGVSTAGVEGERSALAGFASGRELEASKARDAPELVAQGVGVLVLAEHEVEAGAAGDGQVHEDVG